jgi:hypothetical protein
MLAVITILARVGEANKPNISASLVRESVDVLSFLLSQF